MFYRRKKIKAKKTTPQNKRRWRSEQKWQTEVGF